MATRKRVAKTTEKKSMSKAGLDLNNRLAKNIATVRKGKKMTQQDLAVAASLSVSYVSVIERSGGDRDVPTSTIAVLAKALGVDPVVLFKE